MTTSPLHSCAPFVRGIGIQLKIFSRFSEILPVQAISRLHSFVPTHRMLEQLHVVLLALRSGLQITPDRLEVRSGRKAV
jgi:hypothetical protein